MSPETRLRAGRSVPRRLLWMPLLATLSLPACGRKPEGLLPPENATADAYPQVYPRPLPGESPEGAPASDLQNKYKARPEQSLQ